MSSVMNLGQGHASRGVSGMGQVLGPWHGTSVLFKVSLHKCAAILLSMRQTNASTPRARLR